MITWGFVIESLRSCKGHLDAFPLAISETLTQTEVTSKQTIVDECIDL